MGNSKAQLRRGQIASAIGIGCNVVLAALKITFGLLFSLVSVAADGVNNLSDCGSGVVSLVSQRISVKPADKEHPYGHQRAEYIASLMIGFFVLLLAVELFRESIEKILSGDSAQSFWGIYVLLGASVAVKAGMFVLYFIVGKQVGSDSLKASAKDSACDCIATLAVGVGLVISEFTGFAADGWAGLLVALFIVWAGVGIVREASSKLLGRAPDPALIENLRKTITETEGVLGLHDLKVFRYGPQKYFATAHIEMDASLSAVASHEVIDGLERKILEETGVELTGHLDPVDCSDEEAKELEERIRAAADGIVEGLDLHDFRLVRGVKKKIIFEAAVPFSCSRKDGEIRAELERLVRLISDCEPIISVERE